MKIENVKEYIEKSMSGVDAIASQLDDLVTMVVEKSCSELDNYVAYVKALLDDETRPITDIELDDIVMTLPTLLYFASVNQEVIGLREDIAKMHENNAYSEALQDATGTVQEKQSYAKSLIQNEMLTTIVYQRATKQIKAKTDTALEVLQSCKKVLTRRMSELDISNNAPNRMQKG
jgi:hypothetical protein